MDVVGQGELQELTMADLWLVEDERTPAHHQQPADAAKGFPPHHLVTSYWPCHVRLM